MRRLLTKRDAGKKEPEHGQAMVEFMLVIVFLCLLIVSVIQMILLMYAYNTLADAAKEGVRYAIVHGTDNSNCSGPGNPNVTPKITCTDSATPPANVVAAVTNFAGLSFQNILSSEVNVDYDPNGANTTTFAHPCSAPGCLVRVTVSHTYTPLFGFSWPSFTLNAAADGRIMN